MISKLAGHLPLADMITNLIDGARTKLAAEEGGDKDKVKKLVKYEKKEHGHIPTEKEEEAEHEHEKKASVIDPTDPEEIEKLASALDQVGDELIKTAGDVVETGGESKGGGTVLPTMAPVGGKQSYKKDSSKSHNVPMHTPEKSTKDNPGPATAVMADEKSGPLLKYLHSKQSPKIMKTAAESVMEKIRAAGKGKDEKKESKKDEHEEHESKSEEKKEHKDGEEKKAASVLALEAAVTKMAAPEKDKKDEKKQEKKSSVSYILDKLAEGEQERRMGGMTLDSKSGDGPKPPSGSKGGNNARSMIESNKAATDAKKVQTKAPQKKMMAEVLTEPALSKAHDSKVQDNLRNAAKGGVKIAASRELLKKIAAEGCTCDGKGECKYCKMKKSMEKKSMGGMPMTGSPGAGSSMPGPMM